MIADKLERLGTREKAGLLVALVLIFSVMVDRLAVHFITQEISNTQIQIEEKSEELKINLGILKTEGMVSRKFDQIRPRLGPGRPAAEAIDNLKGRIDELARESGVAIDSMKHREPPVSVRPYSEYSVDIGKYEAPMSALLAFLHKLHTTPDIWRVSKLTMAPNPASGQVRGSLSIIQLTAKAEQAPETAGAKE